jgi:hypothetical protein
MNCHLNFYLAPTWTQAGRDSLTTISHHGHLSAGEPCHPPVCGEQLPGCARWPPQLLVGQLIAFTGQRSQPYCDAEELLVD